MRAQTTLDFAIGVSLFLAVMVFVFAFVPGILEPFELSGDQDTVLSERTASKLSQGMLGDPAEPYVLGSHCTVQFFDTGSPAPSHCGYDGQSLHDRLAFPDHRRVNVSLEGYLDGRTSEIVCWDAASQRLVGQSDGSCTPTTGDDEVLAAGARPPDANDATVTSRRVVSLHQQNVTMRVVVW